MQPRCYLARPVTHYGLKQDMTDIRRLRKAGFRVSNPNSKLVQEAYKARGMGVFYEMILNCDALAYRTFSDGRIGAGVGAEIAYARAKGKLVFKLDDVLEQEPLSIEETRARVKEGLR